MNFNKHLELEGKHAFLSPSKYHWLNYTKERLVQVYENQQAKLKGTLLHQFACDAITYGIPLRDDGSTISMYVNDCISDGLSPEVVLYYSSNAFGTADGISFEDNFLRIYDFKSGVTPASIKQLSVYAGLFCLEYGIDPNDIRTHLRIYQNSSILSHDPEPGEIWDVMDRIVAFDNVIQSIKQGG